MSKLAEVFKVAAPKVTRRPPPQQYMGRKPTIPPRHPASAAERPMPLAGQPNFVQK